RLVEEAQGDWVGDRRRDIEDEPGSRALRQLAVHLLEDGGRRQAEWQDDRVKIGGSREHVGERAPPREDPHPVEFAQDWEDPPGTPGIEWVSQGRDATRELAGRRRGRRRRDRRPSRSPIVG